MPHLSCKICSSAFYARPNHIKRGWGKYCSINCRNKSQFTGKYLSCHNCGKRIYRTPATINKSQSKKYFCSKSCQTHWRNKHFSGNKHANWIIGKYGYRNILKRSNKKQECYKCNITDKRILAAHHIDFNRENNTLENLIWLCYNCHYLVHKGCIKI